MSFYDNVADAASRFWSGITQEDVAKAASAHALRMDPGSLVDALLASLPGLNAAAVTSLGVHVLRELSAGANGAPLSADSGTNADAVASGSLPAVEQLIEFARSRPRALGLAASAFFKENPQAVLRLSPTILDDIKAEIGARQ